MHSLEPKSPHPACLFPSPNLLRLALAGELLDSPYSSRVVMNSRSRGSRHLITNLKCLKPNKQLSGQAIQQTLGLGTHPVQDLGDLDDGLPGSHFAELQLLNLIPSCLCVHHSTKNTDSIRDDCMRSHSGHACKALEQGPGP
eukprot:scaffold83739_cov18-Tisochrysis_lutea.AAC.1